MPKKAHNLVTKLKTNEKPLQWKNLYENPIPLEGSLKNQLQVVYLQNLSTTRLTIATFANTHLPSYHNSLKTSGIFLSKSHPLS